MQRPFAPDHQRTDNGARLSLRGTLVGAHWRRLVLLLLALLFWQLLDRFRETPKNQRQYTIDYTADLAAQVSLNMALNAQIALNLLPIVEQPQSPDEQQELLANCKSPCPTWSAWHCSARPESSSMTAPTIAKTPFLSELVQSQRCPASLPAMPSTARRCICCCIGQR